MKIQIAYDGDALKSGDMDVEELAPALLAIGSTLQEANSLLNEGSAHLKVKVKSDFKTGSFEVAFELVQSLAEQAAFLLEGKRAWSAKEIAEFLGLTSSCFAGLIGFVRWLKRRKVKSTTSLENGDVEIEVEGGDRIVTKPEVVRLTKSISVRTSLHAVLKPLSKQGIEVFFVRHKKENIETVRKADVDAFAPQEVDDRPLTDTVRSAAFQLVGVSFEDGLKWRLSDGDARISAEMKDDNFQQKIDAGLPFRKGDILILKLRTTQVQTATGIKNEHVIEKIENHIPKAEQGELPI